MKYKMDTSMSQIS